MGFMDKFLDAMRLNEDDDDDYLDDEYYEEEISTKKSSYRRKEAEESIPKRESSRRETTSQEKERVKQNKITPIRRSSGKQGQDMEVCVIKPTSVDDEREITETLLNGRAVVINMEGLDVSIAQRIIDFTSGSTFAIHGNLQKISNYIFIATPSSVDVSGDLQSLIGSGDFSDLSF